MARRGNDSSVMSQFLGGNGASSKAGSVDYVRANKQRIADIEGFTTQRRALEEVAVPSSPPKTSKYEHVSSRLAAVGATTRPAVRPRTDSAGSAENNDYERVGSAASFGRRTGSAASVGGARRSAAAQQPLPSKFNRPEVLPKKPSVPTREEVLPMPAHAPVDFIAVNARAAAGKPSTAPASPGKRHFYQPREEEEHHHHHHYHEDGEDAAAAVDSYYHRSGEGEGEEGYGREEDHHYASTAHRASAGGRATRSAAAAPAWGAGPGLTARAYDPLMQGPKTAPLAATVVTGGGASEVGKIVAKHAEYGAVPKYLKERQAEWSAVEEAKKKAEADKDIPKGMRVMQTQERLEMLEMLKEGIQEAKGELRTFKLILTVPSQIKRKADLEAKLAKMEEAVGVFSKERVFVKA